jgi:uncharacterized membrane protein
MFSVTMVTSLDFRLSIFKKINHLNHQIMKANMGTADKTIRILLAITVGTLYYFGIISGILAIILGALALIFIITSFINICPLYLPFGISTRPKSAEKK